MEGVAHTQKGLGAEAKACWRPGKGTRVRWDWNPKLSLYIWSLGPHVNGSGMFACADSILSCQRANIHRVQTCTRARVAILIHEQLNGYLFVRGQDP